MSHSKHVNEAGDAIPSVSQIPGIFAHDMRGFEDYICLQTHGYKGSHPNGPYCCTKEKRAFYESAADLGNDIHELREAFLNGTPFSDGVPEYQARVFDPVARFYKESGYKPMFIEEQMTGTEFGGTLDGAGTFTIPFWEKQRVTFWDKKTREYMKKHPGCIPVHSCIWIEDLKIKSKLDILHPLQLYGYAQLLKETKDIEVGWGLIIRREKNLSKTPEIQLRGYYLPAYKEEFDASLHMWKFING